MALTRQTPAKRTNVSDLKPHLSVHVPGCGCTPAVQKAAGICRLHISELAGSRRSDVGASLKYIWLNHSALPGPVSTPHVRIMMIEGVSRSG